MTPAELEVYADAYADRQRQTAYLQGLIMRAMIGSLLSGKRAPTYTSLFGSEIGTETAGKSQNMTDNQMFAAVMALNKAFGGSCDFSGEGVK